MRIPHVMCLVHNQEMSIKRTGMLVECVLSDGDPYYKVYGDAWGCPGEDCTVILPAQQPAVKHFEDHYGDYTATAVIKLF